MKKEMNGMIIEENGVSLKRVLVKVDLTKKETRLYSNLKWKAQIRAISRDKSGREPTWQPFISANYVT